MATLSHVPARVLLVEDEPDFVEVVKFAGRGTHAWSVLEHRDNLADAIEALPELKPDLVMLDLNLPDSSGTETVRRMAQHAGRIPIVVLTSLDDDEAAYEALRAGAQDYLFKSDLDRATLARTIRYAIERSGLIDALQRQQEALAEFATHAAHDLRAPLRTMASFAQLLDSELRPTLSDEHAEYLGYIRSGASRLQDLIADLIGYAHAGHDEALRPVSLATIVDEVHRDLAAVLQASNAQLVVTALPSVVGEPTGLRQVFRNLVGNAIKFCGDRPPRIEISATRAGKRTVVEVRDHGIGMKADDAERIFMPFIRLHAPHAYAGSGLGLATVRRVVVRHGGTIAVSSQPGHGAAFTFDLQTA